MRNKQSDLSATLISLTIINITFHGPVYIKYAMLAGTVVLLYLYIIEYNKQKKTNDKNILDTAGKR